MKAILNFIAGLARRNRHRTTRIGTFPKCKSSTVALVLAKLLAGQKVNAIEFVSEVQTSRVKDLVASLRHQHGWGAICSEKVALGTVYGRVQWVNQYWLPEDVVVESLTDHSLEWRRQVIFSWRHVGKSRKPVNRRTNAPNNHKRLIAARTVGGKK